MAVHRNLSTSPKISELSLHFMYHLHFLFVQHHRSILSAKNILETVLGEALNDKEIYLQSDRGTQLVNPGPTLSMPLFPRQVVQEFPRFKEEM